MVNLIIVASVSAGTAAFLHLVKRACHNRLTRYRI